MEEEARGAGASAGAGVRARARAGGRAKAHGHGLLGTVSVIYGLGYGGMGVEVGGSGVIGEDSRSK